MNKKKSYLNKKRIESYLSYLNSNLIRNVAFFSGGIILFIIGCIAYGVILNLRDVPLSQDIIEKGFSKLDDPNIVINRQSYTLNLYEDTVLIKSYRANFGRNVNVPKTKAGDLATPVGDYQICEIDTVDKYYKFFKINYPNEKDAAEALKKGWITQDEYDRISFEYNYGQCPDSNTLLGGNIGIQGIGRLNFIFRYLPFNYNWTDGSVAISNESIDEIYTVVKKGTKVVIK
ncbi:MAG: L,D-transpeptidase [Bacteroidetes bacterium]|nr:L,D-transpeptidase [Bacteroidota bacterium]